MKGKHSSVAQLWRQRDGFGRDYTEPVRAGWDWTHSTGLDLTCFDLKETKHRPRGTHVLFLGNPEKAPPACYEPGSFSAKWEG